MTGVVALHGGGEFLPGDEAFLAALLDATRAGAAAVHAVIVPTAAARGRPDLAAAHGVAALERAGVAAGRTVEASMVRVTDASSAADPELAARLAAADLIHLPGGDPDLIPRLYPGTPVWAAIRRALDGGAVLAGASAGAMALAERTWTPGGLVDGLGLVPGCLVAPHADAEAWGRNLRRFAAGAALEVAVLGLAERTGVIGTVGGHADGSTAWRVVGEGEVRWLPAGETDPDRALVARAGDTLVVGAATASLR